MPRGRKQQKSPKPPINQFTEGWEDRIGGTPPPLVRVVWLDAGADFNTVLETKPGWVDNYAQFGCVMESVGYLLLDDGVWVVIAPECHRERNSGFRRLEHIPRYAVCEMVTLEG